MRLPAVVLVLCLAAWAKAGTVKENEKEAVNVTKDGEKVAVPETPEVAAAETITEQAVPTTQRSDEVKSDDNSTEGRISYEGAQIIRALPKNKEQRKFIRELESNGEIETWYSNSTVVDMVIRKPQLLELLKRREINYEVSIADLQNAIDEENPQLSQEEMDEFIGRKGHRLTWQMYHRMEDIHGYLDYLANTYPDKVTVSTIGSSLEGKPLKLIKLSSGEGNKNAIWVDAGIHAREWITPASITYVINQMIEGGDGTKGVDWYILPLVNPDGYEHAHTRDRLWRKNRRSPDRGSCAGVDLNRNFGYRWGGQGASRQPCRETFAGTGAFSEPETSAINQFVTGQNGKIKAYVSLHSYGQYILYPWGYDRKVPPDYEELSRVGKLMATAIRKAGGPAYTVGSAANTLYPASGGSDDWAKGSAKIKYAYTIELRDTGRHGFVLPANYINPTAKDAYAALDALAGEIAKL